ncbi:MAG: polysaccharide deacetylase family protein [Acidimicrobiaceae bacterium]|nr:polysaccharide deacetylase family protein [Acidimicrobiaceae bacterium]
MERLTLTFDNGPTPGVTDRVLDELGQRGLQATFFIVGEDLARPGARELAERAKQEAHWIGNHTMTHGVPLGERGIDDPGVQEIDDAERLLADLAQPEKLFRPNGRGVVGRHLLSRDALQYLMANRFTVVLWSIYVADTKAPEGWVDRALQAMASQDWSVLVAHDVASGAMDDLPRLLDSVLRSGVDIVQQFPSYCLPLVCGRPGEGLDQIAPPL